MDIFIGTKGFKFERLRAMPPWKMAEMMSNTFAINRYRHISHPSQNVQLDSFYGNYYLYIADKDLVDYTKVIKTACETCDKEFRHDDFFVEIKHVDFNVDDKYPYSYYELYALIKFIFGHPKNWRNRRTIIQIWNLDITKFDNGLLPYISGVMGIRDIFVNTLTKFNVHKRVGRGDDVIPSLWKPSFIDPIMYQINYGGNTFFMFGDADPNSEMCVYLCHESMFDARYSRDADNVKEEN